MVRNKKNQGAQRRPNQRSLLPPGTPSLLFSLQLLHVMPLRSMNRLFKQLLHRSNSVIFSTNGSWWSTSSTTKMLKDHFMLCNKVFEFSTLNVLLLCSSNNFRPGNIKRDVFPRCQLKLSVLIWDILSFLHLDCLVEKSAEEPMRPQQEESYTLLFLSLFFHRWLMQRMNQSFFF